MHVNKYFHVAKIMFSKAFVGVIFNTRPQQSLTRINGNYVSKLSVSCLLYTLTAIFGKQMVCPETHTKRQATQHGCLPSLLGDGDKGLKYSVR
jgi:hypothetical protein